jgi:hypothetical protein
MLRYFATFAALAQLAFPAGAFQLIHDNEAKLPVSAGALTTRGITRGPGIKQITPDPAAGALKSPLNLKLAFEPRGGARIDPASIRMTYMRANPIDLSPRIKHGISDQGIELANAEVPPGDHELQVTVQDSEGRKSSHTIKLTVAK